MRLLFAYTFLSLLLSAQPAEAAGSFATGDRVLVKGRFQRKCAARVESLPAPGYARLSFDRAGCGDAAQPYEFRQLQSLTFVEESKTARGTLRKGDHVVVEGYRSSSCAGKVREITRAGYVAVDFDSLLCADTETLRKASELTPVTFVEEASFEKSAFRTGQHVTVPGIAENERCRGVIRRLTDNGLAALEFAELTCAYEGRLFSLGQLKAAPAPGKRRQASGESIFRSVMRQIASKKPAKRAASF